jgi:hypothetical protein
MSKALEDHPQMFEDPYLRGPATGEKEHLAHTKHSPATAEKARKEASLPYQALVRNQAHYRELKNQPIGEEMSEAFMSPGKSRSAYHPAPPQMMNWKYDACRFVGENMCTKI